MTRKLINIFIFKNQFVLHLATNPFLLENKNPASPWAIFMRIGVYGGLALGFLNHPCLQQGRSHDLGDKEVNDK